MKFLYIIRHGSTKEGEKGIILGKMGGILSKKGKKEIKEIATKLLKYNFDKKDSIIISSNLKRALDSTKIIKKIIHIKTKIDPLLAERSAGVAEGKNEKEIDWASYEKLPFLKRKHMGGESFLDIKKRTEKIIKKIKNNKEHTIIIVSHSVVIGIMLSIIKKKDPRKMLKQIKQFHVVHMKTTKK